MDELDVARRPSLAARGIKPRDRNPRGIFVAGENPLNSMGRNPRLGFIPGNHLEDKW